MNCPNCSIPWSDDEAEARRCEHCNYPYDDEDDIIIGYHCLGCNNHQNHEGNCLRCGGSAMDAIYF